MSDTQPNEVPLDDIDALLEQADPEFTKSLEEVRSVETDQSVEIQSLAVEGEAADDPTVAEVEPGGVRRLKARLANGWANLKLRAKNRARTLALDLLVFLKTRPKEFALYAVAMAKVGIKKAVWPAKAFRDADRSRKLMAVGLVMTVAGSAWILAANLKGIWLPQLNQPILRDFALVADGVFTYDPADPGESFYSAFPQERHEFLFKRMKVNLKRDAAHPNPMGAFEMIVLLDSKDTAVEVRDREVELHDLLQRIFEETGFPELESELGKTRLKSRVKTELNHKLTQGWVKDVSFKTFILKP